MTYIVILMSFQTFSSINYGFKNKACGQCDPIYAKFFTKPAHFWSDIPSCS